MKPDVHVGAICRIEEELIFYARIYSEDFSLQSHKYSYFTDNEIRFREIK